MQSKLATLYDSLSRVESLFGFRDAKQTVHKRLDFTELESFHGSDINQLLASLPLGIVPSSRILDAGCGHGGTLLSFISKYSCVGVGISLSPTQIKAAKQIADRLGLSANTEFQVCSYDTPPEGPFELITCVEALLHSHDLSNSYQALANRLHNNGHLVIVEDMFVDSIEWSTHNEAQLLKHYWSISQLHTLNDHLSAAEKAGLKLSKKNGLNSLNLSAYVPTKSAAELTSSIKKTKRLAKYSPIKTVRVTLEAAAGGYILEKYYSEGLANYRMLIFEQNEV